jgi:hypothetical protein
MQCAFFNVRRHCWPFLLILGALNSQKSRLSVGGFIFSLALVMHAKALRILESLFKDARAAYKQGRLKLLRRLLLKAFILAELDREFRLRSPRIYNVRAHFPLISYWAHARTLPKELCDGAYMMFINFPRFVFDKLASLVRPYLPEFDPDVPRRSGRRPLLDYHWQDLLAGP